jgi:biotin operon repressor
LKKTRKIFSKVYIARQLGCSRENIRQKFEKIKKMALLIRRPEVRASDGSPYIAV